ncbi:membrane protein involved in aromatic hydrocarbon degradation [Citrifermentans bremense]|uniref:Membrane protein involved in aromatic hydrocarbon degradation n=1 Tax=Citrifermentans bremense TaxID=60035 RepID=A0A6S6M128_9BACT|nr:OmpP1/FadL family transporter [Citrifermentans bremense]BCG47120.1 membrane protein involved in aromatic hydrocarbon degradation [Citrifermentans bremense]
MRQKKGVLVALLAPMLAFGGAAATAQASGYAVFTHGASALGQGNAVTAHSSDPSTIFYNPALMNKLPGTQVQLGTTGVLSSRSYEPAASGNETSSDTSFFPSHFYATHKVNDQVSVGLGIFNPFGLGTEWGEQWDGRYIATKSTLKTFNINPAASFQVTPKLAVAAGIDVILLDASLEKKVPSQALGLPANFDVNQKFKGDGKGVGFNVGVAYDVCDHLSLGASYRSEVKIDVSGNATLTNAALSAGGAPLPMTIGGNTDLTLPPQFTAGAAFKGIDKLVLEAGVRWEGWSKFKELAVHMDNGQIAATPRNWKDAWGANAGGRYQMNDTVALLAGYVYGDTPVPDSTFDPSIPDAKTHVFCAGTDLNFNPLTVAFSYGYQLLENRHKDNGIPAAFPASAEANGKYKTDAHLVALSVGYKF